MKQGHEKPSKSLLAIPAGIKQKEVVDKIVSKVIVNSLFHVHFFNVLWIIIAI